jgi:hypothetical protein
MSKHSITVSWEGIDLIVGGDYTEGEPEYRGGHPDTWEEGYGSCFDVESIEYNQVRQLSLEDSYASEAIGELAREAIDELLGQEDPNDLWEAA